jgi:cyclopropane-fatty-acyl-phospholipid synthase
MAIERHLLARLLADLNVPELAFTLWDGRSVSLPAATPTHRLLVRDRPALWLLLAFPEYYFPEMYAQGRILVGGDLEGLLELLQRARAHLNPGSLRRRAACALFRPSEGSLQRARENIHHHYDLGNDFYRLWLDERMLYTCAYFAEPDMSLEQAQLAKMDHVCRKLRLRPGERVVEAGCGWGSLALHMARHYGVTVRAFNISSSQLALARETVRKEGLDKQVEFIEDDYRNIDGEYDAFVSVGMLEHVGTRHYPDLGRLIDRCLAPHGRGIIHTIGTDRPGPLNSWIERRIFPGAHPPSLDEMTPMLGQHGLSVLDVENLRLHYAKTLAHWLERYEAAQDRLPPRCDAQFVRTWRFYLASAQASFATGHLQLFQVLFARRGFNDIPWTRESLYRDAQL